MHPATLKSPRRDRGRKGLCGRYGLSGSHLTYVSGYFGEKREKQRKGDTL
jgi:hypothetical protein